MAWSEEDFQSSDNRAWDLGNGGASNRFIGLTIASAIFQLGALLAERLPRPGARLYCIAFPAEGCVTIDLDKIYAVSDPFLIGAGPGYGFSIEGQVARKFSFSSEDSCRDSHEKLLAAWGGAT